MAERLLVLAPNWLGDAVMALPAVAALRARDSGAHLGVAARGSVAALFSMVPGVDEVVTLKAGPRRAWRGAGRDAAQLRGQWDGAVLLPNSFLSAWTTWRAAIPMRAGYATDGRRLLLSRAVPLPAASLHQADYYLALARALGGVDVPRLARVQVPSAAMESARALLVGEHIEATAPYVVLAPGAAYGRAKQWLPERFGALARDVCAVRRSAVVIVGASADHETATEVQAHAGAGVRVANLCGRTDLPTLAAVLAGAQSVVANDSGAMHLAAAVGARVVGVFGATDERRTAPLRGRADQTPPAILTADTWCRPCLLRECPFPGHACMRDVRTSQVLEAIA